MRHWRRRHANASRETPAIHFDETRITNPPDVLEKLNRRTDDNRWTTVVRLWIVGHKGHGTLTPLLHFLACLSAKRKGTQIQTRGLKRLVWIILSRYMCISWYFTIRVNAYYALCLPFLLIDGLLDLPNYEVQTRAAPVGMKTFLQRQTLADRQTLSRRFEEQWDFDSTKTNMDPRSHYVISLCLSISHQISSNYFSLNISDTPWHGDTVTRWHWHFGISPPVSGSLRSGHSGQGASGDDCRLHTRRSPSWVRCSEGTCLGTILGTSCTDVYYILLYFIIFIIYKLLDLGLSCSGNLGAWHGSTLTKTAMHRTVREGSGTEKVAQNPPRAPRKAVWPSSSNQWHTRKYKDMIRDSDQVEYEFVLSLLQEATKTLTSNSKHGGIRWNTVGIQTQPPGTGGVFLRVTQSGAHHLPWPLSSLGTVGIRIEPTGLLGIC